MNKLPHSKQVQVVAALVEGGSIIGAVRGIPNSGNSGDSILIK